MRPYEVMIIFNAGTEAPDIQADVDRVLETIRSNDGTPGAIDRWGKRTFAYEVNHQREGYYVLVEFTGEPRTVSELDRFLSLADAVIRHKVVRLPKHVGGTARPSGTGNRSKSAGPAAPAEPAAPEDPAALAVESS